MVNDTKINFHKNDSGDKPALNKINFYENDLNLKEIIQNLDLKNSDQAYHICDLSTIEQKVKLWKRLLARVEPFFAVRSTSDALVMKTLAELGIGFCCDSKSELQQVLNIGVQPRRIIYANPYKPITHLNYAKEQQVATTIVDSEAEIYKIKEHYPQANVILRFRCDADLDAQYPHDEKFGCDADKEAEALLVLAKSLQLKVIGTSFQIGAVHINDMQAYQRAIESAANIFKLGKMIGYDMNTLDIGGGFPGANDEKFEKICNIINESLEHHFSDDNIKIIAEPGQFFVTAANTLVCKIIGKRVAPATGTKMYYVNDGVYGSFNINWHNPQDVVAQHILDDDDKRLLQKYRTIIWGPTCDSVDKITETVYLPDLSRGDVIVFPNIGSYASSMGSNFNGFSLPQTLHFKKLKI